MSLHFKQHELKMGGGVAQAIGERAEKWRVLGFRGVPCLHQHVDKIGSSTLPLTSKGM